MAKEVKENQAVKHPTVKCHGKFKTSIKVNAGKGKSVGNVSDFEDRSLR